jgi:hypothetical protein
VLPDVDQRVLPAAGAASHMHRAKQTQRQLLLNQF